MASSVLVNQTTQISDTSKIGALAGGEVWNPEDDGQWNAGGKRTAFKNLALSIPALSCGFAVWMFWSIIVVQMQKLGFRFDADPGRNKELLYTLTAIAGLSGATLRIPRRKLPRATKLRRPRQRQHVIVKAAALARTERRCIVGILLLRRCINRL